MKVLPFKIPKPENKAFIYQEDLEVFFYDKLHQHEEIQISLIVNGEGTLVIGDSVTDYKPNDILVIGSHLPHVFKSEKYPSEKSYMLSLFFTYRSFGEHFFELEELQELQSFFKRAAYGFKITSSKKRISNLFLALKTASKFERFIFLLELIKIASNSGYKSLSSFIYEKKYNDIEGKRMRDVMEFTMNNYFYIFYICAVNGYVCMESRNTAHSTPRRHYVFAYAREEKGYFKRYGLLSSAFSACGCYKSSVFA